MINQFDDTNSFNYDFSKAKWVGTGDRRGGGSGWEGGGRGGGGGGGGGRGGYGTAWVLCGEQPTKLK